MIAREGIYEDGKVFFPFNFPDTDGPVQVMVIFPGNYGIHDFTVSARPPLEQEEPCLCQAIDCMSLCKDLLEEDINDAVPF